MLPMMKCVFPEWTFAVLLGIGVRPPWPFEASQHSRPGARAVQNKGSVVYVEFSLR